MVFLGELWTRKSRPFGANVLSSVSIVIINRKLLGESSFPFPNVLTSLHLISSGYCALSWNRPCSKVTINDTPRRYLPLLVFLNGSCIVLLNISLMVNTVSFYQITKLAMIPVTGVLESFFFSVRLTTCKWLSGMVVVIGAGLATVSDFNIILTMNGLVISIAAVFVGSIQQIIVRYLQVVRDIDSIELMSSILPWSGLGLFIFAPFLDFVFYRRNVLEHKWGYNVTILVFISCIISIGVNVSQFYCLRKFSASEFQICGHLKTILILLSSIIIFGESISIAKFSGAVVTMIGLVSYAMCGGN